MFLNNPLKIFLKSLTLLALLLGLAAFSAGCAKQECDAPCELVAKCADENVKQATAQQMQILKVACPQVCSKHYRSVNLCYQDAQKNQDDPCHEFMQCIKERYQNKKF